MSKHHPRTIGAGGLAVPTHHLIKVVRIHSYIQLLMNCSQNKLPLLLCSNSRFLLQINHFRILRAGASKKTYILNECSEKILLALKSIPLGRLLCCHVVGETVACPVS